MCVSCITCHGREISFIGKDLLNSQPLQIAPQINFLLYLKPESKVCCNHIAGVIVLAVESKASYFRKQHEFIEVEPSNNSDLMGVYGLVQ